MECAVKEEATELRLATNLGPPSEVNSGPPMEA